VNALGDWVSGIFLNPGLKPWAKEALGYGKWKPGGVNVNFVGR